MAEQYIYSRSETNFTNARGQAVGLGFGFMASSPQMTQALKEEAQMHCGTCPRIVTADSAGARLALFRKVRLSKSGRVLLQRSAWIEGGARPFHVAHGFLLEPAEFLAAPVRGWFTQPFRMGDPNQVPGGVLLDSQTALADGPWQFMPLSQAMEQGLGLDKEQFCRLLLACFEALSARRQVRVVFDFSRPEAAALQSQILFWLYTCLPRALRLDLGFDSIYTEISAPQQVQVVFVDKNTVQGSGLQAVIQVDGQYAKLEGNFLVMDGQVVHNDKYPCAWFGKPNLFSRWLEEVVDVLWKPEFQQLWSTALQDLEKVYTAFETQLAGVPADRRLDPQVYDALCWSQLDSIQLGPMPVIAKRLRPSITPEEERSCTLAVLTLLGGDERSSGAQDQILAEMIQNHQTPTRKDEVDTLIALLGTERLRERAVGMLSAFLALDVDAASPRPRQTLGRYEKTVPPEVWPRLCQGLFFGPADQEGRQVWGLCGAGCDTAACARRRGAWYGETLAGCKALQELPDYVHREIRALKGLEDKQRNQMADEMLSGLLGSGLPQLAPHPTVGDVTALLRACEPYRESALWKDLCALVSELAGHCRPTPAELSLDGLEALQRAFAPHAGENTLMACWQRLFQALCQGLDGKRPMFPMGERLSPRLRELADGLPKQFPKELRDWPEQARLRVWERLLEDPQPFMDGKWLRRELSARPFPSCDTEWAMQLLAEFAGEPKLSVRLWNGLSERYEGTDASRTRVFTRTLPRMFLAGTLPGIASGFVVHFLHSLPSQVEELLLQAAAQGGGTLLLRVINTAEKHEQEMRPGGPTDLVVILRAISTDPRILATAADVDGNLEIDETLAKRIVELEENGCVSIDDARAAVESIYRHCESNGGGALQKMSLKRAADKLRKRS